MRAFPSIKGFLAHLATMPAALHTAQQHGEEAAGKALAHHAQAMIGQESDTWPALAESTVAQKRAKGQTGRISATDPLYATGELRTSISARVEGAAVVLGSTDSVAPFHEFGTARMPARSFIGATMFQHGHAAADTIAEHMIAAVAGNPPPAKP